MAGRPALRRVLHVTSSFPRHVDDAVGPFLLDLAREQAAAGLEVAVVAPHAEGLPVDEVLGGVRVHRARYAPARRETLAYRGGLLGAASGPAGAALVPALLAGMAAATVGEAGRFRPDVVHAHWWLPGGVVAAPASLLRHVPLVITLHGSDVGLARRRGFATAARLVARVAALVAAVSEPLRAEAAEVLRLPAARTAVLRMPLDVAALDPAARPPLPPGPPWRVLGVGRLSPEKGFDVLIDAVGRARAAGVPLELELVGDGPQRAAVDAALAGLGRWGRRLDPLPREVLHERIAAAHAVAVPSRREGLGLVAVEALALGRPVVASRAGGLVEVVDPAAGDGLLVPPGDAGALAEGLARLPLPMPEPERPAVRRHRPDVVVAAHLAAYERVVAARAR
ncbi:MAG: glycosyltransferase [Acidimicrobiales bacterium]|nr:glycosyltransferase [Acidimicrobiales bacterium]